MKAKVAERGQVTIPQKIRRKLGIRPGTVLNFEAKGHVLIAIKFEEIDNVNQVYGCLGKNLQTDKIISELRGE